MPSFFGAMAHAAGSVHHYQHKQDISFRRVGDVRVYQSSASYSHVAKETGI
jgi:hypothetical protein